MRQRFILLCAVALPSIACDDRAVRSTSAGMLSDADRSALAAAWHGAPVLAAQATPSCTTITVGRSTTRCGSSPPMASAMLTRFGAIATTLAARLQHDRSALALQSMAVLDAVSDQEHSAALDRAALLLDEAGTHAGASAATQVDRAALHLQRYAVANDVIELLAGLDAAAIASALAPGNWRACWNHALALTWLAARNAAHDEWARCDRIGRAPIAPRITDDGSALRDTSRALALAGRWREATREYAWSTVLPMWGRAVRTQHADSAALALALLDQAVRHTAAPDSESSLLAARRDLHGSSEPTRSPARSARLGHAFELLALARSPVARQNPALARATLDSALALSQPRDEAHRWIQLQLANLALTNGDAAQALDAYRRLRPLARDTLSVFASRIAWGEAIALASLGRSALAFSTLGDVGVQCRRLHLESCELGTITFRTDLAALLGDDESSVQGIPARSGRDGDVTDVQLELERDDEPDTTRRVAGLSPCGGRAGW